MSSLFGGGGPKAKQPTAAMGLDLQSAEYGKCLSVAFGKNKWAGTVIWYGNFKAIKHKEKPAGGKGGGTPKQTRFTYTASYMVAMCEGSATVSQVYDGAAITSLSNLGGVAFSGALGQAPWSHLVGNEAIGYSGTATIGFANKDLGDNPSLPNFSFEMNGLAQLNPGGGVYDADPKDIATIICTDTRVGVNFEALGDLTHWSNYCRAAGLLFSPVYDTQQPALQVLSELLKYSNSEGWYSEGVLKVKPRGDRALTGNGVTYTPDLTPVANLGPNDLITNGPGPAVQIKRKSPADAMNVVRIEHRERSQRYRTVPATATIDDDVVSTGVRAETSETVDMITSSPVGQLVATNMVNRNYYVRNEMEFKTSWRYCYLEPMDIVTLTDPDTGLDLAPVLLLEVSEDAEGLLSFRAEEMPEGVGHAAFLDPQTAEGLGVDPEADPGPVTTPYFFRAPNALVSVGAPEVWVAIAGSDPMWAGCDVYISRDGSSYTYHSTFARESTYGVVNTALGVTADPYTGTAINVTLNGGTSLLGCTAQECDDFVTLSMIDDEIVAYQSATLAAGPSYNLGTRIRRGGYGSPIVPHSVGAKFVRLDDDILRIPVDPSQVGQTIYVKFVSLNCFGRGGRTLAAETAYPYVIGTRSDFPDVPEVPGAFAVKSVIDGINLTWTNVNPAAVACTSVEFATSPSGPFTVLGQAGPTQTTFHHAFDTGATYYYRLRARGHQVSSGWSDYTAVMSTRGRALSGAGVNILPHEYSLFEQGSPPTTVRNATVVPALPVLDTGALIFGTPMLKWTSTGTDGYVYFNVNSASNYNIPVTAGKKWIVSFYCKASVASAQLNVYLRRNSDAAHTLGTALTTSGTANTVTRVSSVVDLTAFPATDAVILRVDCDVAADFWIGGIMIEEMVGTVAAPSAYARGTYSSMVASAIAAASAAQDTADGKIVTYIQASMPTGGRLGDLWFDSDDGNKMYRHNGTTFVVAQDTAIGQAILAAAGAQATADGKIVTYYKATAPTSSDFPAGVTAFAVGDLWYNTTAKNLSRWNGSAWVQIADITEEKIGGNGTNVIWEEYSLLKAVMSTLSDPNKSLPICNSATLTTLEVVKNAAAVGGYEYHAVTGGTSASSDYFRLSESATDNNVRVGGNRKYLISYYARSTTAGHQIRPWVRGAATIDGGIVSLTTTRTRYSYVFDLSGVADGDVHFGFFCNTAGVAGRHVYIDGVMVEPMEGNNATPSPFLPGQSARQAWRAILNAQNMGNGRNLVGNPSCTDNFVGGDGAILTATGDIYCDNWYCGLLQVSAGSALQTYWDKVTGRSTNGASIFIGYGNGNAIAAGATLRTIALVRRRWAVIPGEKYTISCWARGDFNIAVPAGVTCSVWLRAAFYDGSGTFLSYAQLAIPRAGGWVKQVIPTFTVPANAASMDVRIDFNATNGNGTTTTIAAGNNWAWILRATDFEVYKITNLDEDVEDGTTYGRYGVDDGFVTGGVRRIGLRFGNSGHRLGNQRNIPRSNTSAYGMTRTTTALSATSAGAVTVNAHTCRYGGYSVSYSAVSNAVTGLTVGSTYVIYCSDPDLTGGVKTYFAGTNPDAVMNISDDIYVVGQITIPSSGSSSGGGGSTGGDPNDWCVAIDQHLPNARYAYEVEVDDQIECWDEQDDPGIEWLPVESNTIVDLVECMRIETESGAAVVASRSTPMTLRDHSIVYLPDMLGREALVHRPGQALRWERVIKLESVGRRAVAKIKVHQRCYFAGEDPDATIATHNPTYKP